MRSRTTHPIIWLAFGAWAGLLACTQPSQPPAAAPHILTDLVNKEWQVKAAHFQEIIGMMHKNRPDLDAQIARYGNGGMSFVFFEDGKFTIRMEEDISYGSWQTAPNSQSVICRYRKKQAIEEIRFTKVILSPKQLTSDLYLPKFQMHLQAVGTPVSGDYRTSPFYPL